MLRTWVPFAGAPVPVTSTLARMNFDLDFLTAVADSDICSAYYSLCREHPLRIGGPIEKAPATAVLKAAAGRVSLSKLSGPGTVFQLGGLPDNLSLTFIVQSRTRIETVRIGQSSSYPTHLRATS